MMTMQIEALLVAVGATLIGVPLGVILYRLLGEVRARRE